MYPYPRSRQLQAYSAFGFFIGLTPAMPVFGRGTMVVVLAPALLIGCFLLVQQRVGPRSLLQMFDQPLIRAGTVICVLSVLLAFNSVDPWGSASTSLRTWVLGMSGYAIFLVLSSHPSARDAAESGLCIGAIGAALYCLATYFLFGRVVFPLYREDQDPTRIAIVFKAYASVIPMLTAALLGLAWYRRHSWRGLWYLGAALLGLLALVGDGSEIARSALAALLAALCIAPVAGAVIMMPARWRPAILAFGALVAAGMAVWVFETLRVASAADPFRPPLPLWLVDMHRQAIWGFVWAKALEAPLLGWGVNAINMVPDAKILVPGMFPVGEFVPSHPHNFLLEFLAELGFPMGGALLLLVIAIIVRIGPWRQGREMARWTVLAVFAAFWTASVSNFSIWSYWWLACMILMVAIIAARFEAAPGMASDPGGPR